MGLEALNRAELIQLARGLTMPVHNVGFPELKVGTLIKAVTEGGDTYLFEVVHPSGSTGRVIRIGPEDSSVIRYHGVRTITPVLKVGEVIQHEKTISTPVRKLFLK